MMTPLPVKMCHTQETPFQCCGWRERRKDRVHKEGTSNSWLPQTPTYQLPDIPDSSFTHIKLQLRRQAIHSRGSPAAIGNTGLCQNRCLYQLPAVRCISSCQVCRLKLITEHCQHVTGRKDSAFVVGRITRTGSGRGKGTTCTMRIWLLLSLSYIVLD